MKIAKHLLFLWITLMLSSCAGAKEKAAMERRNLMMPQQSELRRNSKYKPAKSNKTYSNQKKKDKKNNR